MTLFPYLFPLLRVGLFRRHPPFPANERGLTCICESLRPRAITSFVALIGRPPCAANQRPACSQVQLRRRPWVYAVHFRASRISIFFFFLFHFLFFSFSLFGFHPCSLLFSKLFRFQQAAARRKKRDLGRARTCLASVCVFTVDFRSACAISKGRGTRGSSQRRSTSNGGLCLGFSFFFSSFLLFHASSYFLFHSIAALVQRLFAAPVRRPFADAVF